MPGRKRTNQPETQEPQSTETVESTEEVPQPVEQSPDQTQASEPVEVSPDAPKLQQDHDETDVQAAIDSETQDGPGEGDVPPSDFKSYASPDAEQPEKTTEQLADEILKGDWGKYATRRQMLKDAGHNPAEVEREVNRRLAAGAPYAYRPSLTEVAAQVIRGEWGTEVEQKQRLESAGFSYVAVKAEVDRQLGN